MQTRIANGVIRIQYADGQNDEIELVPPFNFWSLCGYAYQGQGDYPDVTHQWPLQGNQPAIVQLGENCRAILVSRRLKANRIVEQVALETLSQEVVIGLMGVTVLQ